MQTLRRSVVLAATGAITLAVAGVVATSSQAADGDKTYLILETDGDGADWIYEGDSYQALPEKDCSVVVDNPLVTMSGSGQGQATLGFQDNGFGVKSKGPGTNCGQVSDSQAVEVSLGPDTRGAGDVRRLVTDAELDIESKFACELSAEYFRGDVKVGAQTIPLSPRSDCGPDSNDNVRVALDVPAPGADRIVLRPGADGTISLEGGFESGPVLDDGLIDLAPGLETTGSVFELTEGAGVIPESGTVEIRDPSGAIATILNNSSGDEKDIPYFSQPCDDAEPCVNFKLMPDEGDPEFYRLTAYVSFPVDNVNDQQVWAGEIDFDGNNGGSSFALGELATGANDSNCVIDETLLGADGKPVAQACITSFVFPDPSINETGGVVVVNPALAGDDTGIKYRTDVWDLWISDPNIR